MHNKERYTKVPRQEGAENFEVISGERRADLPRIWGKALQQKAKMNRTAVCPE